MPDTEKSVADFLNSIEPLMTWNIDGHEIWVRWEPARIPCAEK